jgi:N-acetylglucosaminyldiphosphoundecaprenol N-acetyl-beta-D-mannosaminyltransferase
MHVLKDDKVECRSAIRNAELVSIVDTQAPSIRTVAIAGFKIHALTRQQTAKYLCDFAVARRDDDEPPPWFTSVNGQVVSICQHNHRLRELIEKSPILSCDSQPMTIFSRLSFRPGPGLPERVATTDLIHDVAQMAVDRNISFYLFGGTEDTNQKAAAELLRLYPKLKIVGRRHGYFSSDDEAAICANINALRPDIVWLGLGVPLEQEFAERNRKALNQIGLIKTSGGCFKILSGEIGRAPLWVQNLGLEWMGRLIFEPKHVMLRYFTSTPAAIWLALTKRFSS